MAYRTLNSNGKMLAFGHGILLLVLLSFFRMKGLAFGDGLGFLEAILDGTDGDSNATNHLFYIQFLKLCYTYLDWLPLGDRLLIPNAVGILLLVYHLNCLGFRLKEMNYNAVLVASTALVLGFTCFKLACLQEVYVLFAGFWVGALRYAYQILQRNDRDDTHNFLKMGLYFGIAMGIHIYGILFLPVYLYVLFGFWHRLWPKVVALIPLLFFGLLVVPVFQGRNTFNSVFFDYGAQEAVLSFPVSTWGWGLGLGLALLIYNFPIGIFFFLKGLSVMQKGRAYTLAPFLFLALVGAGYASRFSALEVYTFYLPVYVAMFPFLCNGLNDLFASRAASGLKVAAAVLVMAGGPLIYWVLYELSFQKEVISNYLPEEYAKKLNQASEQKSYKGGLAFYVAPFMHQMPDALEVIKSASEEQNLPEVQIEDMAHAKLKGMFILCQLGEIKNDTLCEQTYIEKRKSARVQAD